MEQEQGEEGLWLFGSGCSLARDKGNKNSLLEKIEQALPFALL
jgi:hypothetical protein